MKNGTVLIEGLHELFSRRYADRVFRRPTYVVIAINIRRLRLMLQFIFNEEFGESG